MSRQCDDYGDSLAETVTYREVNHLPSCRDPIRAIACVISKSRKGKSVQRKGEGWFALTVRGNHEVTVCSLLRSKSIETFTPTYIIRRRWSDRIKQVRKPLFPGYVFSRFDPSCKLRVLTTPQVYGVVGIGRDPSPIPEVEITALQVVAQSGIPTEPSPFLKVGMRTRIARGPLAGLEGILVQVKKRWRVIVSVTLIERSVSVEVSADMLQPDSSNALASCPYTA
jgi:transcriptional antiterminator NusG